MTTYKLNLNQFGLFKNMVIGAWLITFTCFFLTKTTTLKQVVRVKNNLVSIITG